MADNTSPSSSLVLSYAGPMARRRRPMLGLVVAFLGVSAWFLGLLMLVFGIVQGFDFASHPKRLDVSDEVIVVTMFTAIGAGCFVLGAQWCQSGRRLFTGGR